MARCLAVRGSAITDTDRVIAAASALELLQGFALIHDDLMDTSDLRRASRPSIDSSPRDIRPNDGKARRKFSVTPAILAGDLCLVWADEMLHDSGMNAERLFAAAPIYNAMRESSIGGQYLDILTQAPNNRACRRVASC